MTEARTGLLRPYTTVEELLLEMAAADAELINGGFVENASQQYTRVLKKIDEILTPASIYEVTVLHAHCLNGMARICQARLDSPKENDSHESDYAEKSIEILSSLETPDSFTPLSIWHLKSTFVVAKAHQLSVARQLVADMLIERGQCEDARSFLEAAVSDSPIDAEAALALGAFMLRMVFYSNASRDPKTDKLAQVQLLKAAKLDPSKANPFGLLGLWFEEQGDSKRAEGCFRKSLGLDPCNPIAGRGLLRLLGRENVQNILDDAININSALNGWAWNAIGLHKAYTDGEDDLAVVAILKGLRCRDVSRPSSENLWDFLSTPKFIASRKRKGFLPCRRGYMLSATWPIHCVYSCISCIDRRV